MERGDKEGEGINMKKEMKYYIGRIDERNGEFEYNTKYLFRTTECSAAYNDKTAQGWRGSGDDELDEDMGGYWCDGSIICAGEVKRIPLEHYNVLKKYLSVL